MTEKSYETIFVNGKLIP